jgi:hypothetical protein
MVFSLVSSLPLIWPSSMGSWRWLFEWQIERLWLFNQFLFVTESNSVEEAILSSGSPPMTSAATLFGHLPFVGSSHTFVLGPQSESFSYSSPWQLRIHCGLIFKFPLSMVKHIIFEIGRQSTNALSWLSLTPLQFPSLLLFPSAPPLLLCLSIVRGFIPRTDSWNKSTAGGKSGKVNKLIYWSRVCVC